MSSLPASFSPLPDRSPAAAVRGSDAIASHPRSRIPALPTLSAEDFVPSIAAPPPAFPLDRLELDRDVGLAALRAGGVRAPHGPAADGRIAALYYLARSGVYHGLRGLGVGPGDTVLMPAYHHGVEVEAVRRTGAEIAFYRVDSSMRVDLDDIRAKAGAAARPRVLYLTYFAGWPQPTDEAFDLARELGLILVEDCALSLFSRDATGRPFGARGELSIFCLYKTLPVPHGGVALSAGPLPLGSSPPLFSTLHHLAGSLRAHARLRGGPSPVLEAVRALARRTVDRAVPHEKIGTQHLDPSQLGLGASALLRGLLARTDAEQVVLRRRRSYARILSALGDERLVPAPLPPGGCPLFFPLLIGDKRRALAALEARNIEAIDFWGEGDAACDTAAFPEVARLRRHVLELPLHQDLDDAAIDRVAAAAAFALATCGRAPA